MTTTQPQLPWYWRFIGSDAFIGFMGGLWFNGVMDAIFRPSGENTTMAVCISVSLASQLFTRFCLPPHPDKRWPLGVPFRGSFLRPR